MERGQVKRMKKTISVIVPVYNSEGTLDKCVTSLLDQTYNDVEVILVDNCSSDNSYRICQEFKKNNKNVLCFSLKSRGVSNARNFGISKSRGDYITFVDSDDYIDASAFEKVINEMEGANANVGIYGIVYEYGRRQKRYSFNSYVFDGALLPRIMFCNYAINGYSCNKIYARELIVKPNETIEFNTRISMMEDNLFNYQVLFNNHDLKCVFVNGVFYHYVQNELSACHKKVDSSALQYLIVRNKQIEMMNGAGINSDFLRIDYIINAFIIRKKMSYAGLMIPEQFSGLFDNADEYVRCKLKPISTRQWIKYFVIRYFPFLLIARIKIKRGNI